MAQPTRIPIPPPKTSIFDITLPGVPGPEAPAAPEKFQDSVPWDEGTAAEWNPKWNQKTAALPEPEAIPEPRPWLRIAFFVTGALASVAVLAALVMFFRPQGTAAKALDPVKPVPAALQPYEAKAKAGDAAAMRMLGLCYCYGIAAPADWQEGILWLKRAAKAGNGTARTELASMGVSLD